MNEFSAETIQECEGSVLLRVAREGVHQKEETPVDETDESTKLVVEKISFWDEPEDKYFNN